MSKRDWRNGLTLGITIGGGLVLIVFLFGQKLYDLTKCYKAGDCNRSAAKYEGQDLPDWWETFGFFVSPSDTLAQWIMALFTVGAVLLVWRTLVATQKMVRETTRIGEAQSRAYIHADKAFFFWGNKEQTRPRVEIWVRNTGLTPAKWYEIRIKEFIYPHEGFDASTPLIDQVTFPEKYEGPWNAIPADSKGNKATFFFDEDETKAINMAATDTYGLSTPSHGISIVGEIRYQTFFGETYVSQFVFGRSILPGYRLDRTETRVIDEITINDNIEKPIPLPRYAAKLETYKKVKS